MQEAEIRIFEEPIDLWSEMAARWRAIAAEAVRARGDFRVAVSGGRTPLGFYCFLGRMAGIPWESTDLFQVDERFVPAGDEDSNFRLIERSLFLRAAVSPGRIHPIATDEGTVSAAAARYEKELRCVFRSPGGRRWPDFDLVLLGIGEDGHTASLFPGSAALDEEEDWVAAVKPATAAHERITLTLPAINHARHVCFMATGGGKAEVVERIRAGADRSLPASLVRPESGSLTFFLDRQAGRAL